MDLITNLKQNIDKYCTAAPHITIIYKWYKDFQNLLQCDTQLSEEYISDLACCIVQYILFNANYCTLAEEFTEKSKQLVTEMLSIIPDVAKIQGVKNILLEKISSPIYEILMDPSLNMWCGREILKVFNNLVMHSDKNLRHTIITKNNKMHLYKLVDLLSTCGDYEHQATILENIFRMCSPEQIKSYSWDLFPEAKDLGERFAAIKGETFDIDIRVFLTKLNHNSTGVFSIAGELIRMDNVEFTRFSCYQDLGLWIDFNMKPKTISLYCNAKITMSGPSAESETETWELITIPYASIKQVKIKLIDNIYTIHIKLCGPPNLLHNTSSTVLQTKNVTMCIEQSQRADTLCNVVIPSMFGDLVSGFGASPPSLESIFLESNTEDSEQPLNRSVKQLMYKPLKIWTNGYVKSTSPTSELSKSTREVLLQHEDNYPRGGDVPAVLSISDEKTECTSSKHSLPVTTKHHTVNSKVSSKKLLISPNALKVSSAVNNETDLQTNASKTHKIHEDTTEKSKASVCLIPPKNSKNVTIVSRKEVKVYKAIIIKDSSVDKKIKISESTDFFTAQENSKEQQISNSEYFSAVDTTDENKKTKTMKKFVNKTSLRPTEPSTNTGTDSLLENKKSQQKTESSQTQHSLIFDIEDVNSKASDDIGIDEDLEKIQSLISLTQNIPSFEKLDSNRKKPKKSFNKNMSSGKTSVKSGNRKDQTNIDNAEQNKAIKLTKSTSDKKMNKDSENKNEETASDLFEEEKLKQFDIKANAQENKDVKAKDEKEHTDKKTSKKENKENNDKLPRKVSKPVSNEKIYILSNQQKKKNKKALHETDNVSQEIPSDNLDKQNYKPLSVTVNVFSAVLPLKTKSDNDFTDIMHKSDGEICDTDQVEMRHLQRKQDRKEKSPTALIDRDRVEKRQLQKKQSSKEKLPNASLPSVIIIEDNSDNKSRSDKTSNDAHKNEEMLEDNQQKSPKTLHNNTDGNICDTDHIEMELLQRKQNTKEKSNVSLPPIIIIEENSDGELPSDKKYEASNNTEMIEEMLDDNQQKSPKTVHNADGKIRDRDHVKRRRLQRKQSSREKSPNASLPAVIIIEDRSDNKLPLNKKCKTQKDEEILEDNQEKSPKSLHNSTDSKVCDTYHIEMEQFQRKQNSKEKSPTASLLPIILNEDKSNDKSPSHKKCRATDNTQNHKEMLDDNQQKSPTTVHNADGKIRDRDHIERRRLQRKQSSREKSPNASLPAVIIIEDKSDNKLSGDKKCKTQNNKEMLEDNQEKSPKTLHNNTVSKICDTDHAEMEQFQRKQNRKEKSLTVSLLPVILIEDKSNDKSPSDIKCRASGNTQNDKEMLDNNQQKSPKTVHNVDCKVHERDHIERRRLQRQQISREKSPNASLPAVIIIEGKSGNKLPSNKKCKPQKDEEILEDNQEKSPKTLHNTTNSKICDTDHTEMEQFQRKQNRKEKSPTTSLLPIIIIEDKSNDKSPSHKKCRAYDNTQNNKELVDDTQQQSPKTKLNDVADNLQNQGGVLENMDQSKTLSYVPSPPLYEQHSKELDLCRSKLRKHSLAAIRDVQKTEARQEMKKVDDTGDFTKEYSQDLLQMQNKKEINKILMEKSNVEVEENNFVTAIESNTITTKSVTENESEKNDQSRRILDKKEVDMVEARGGIKEENVEKENQDDSTNHNKNDTTENQLIIGDKANEMNVSEKDDAIDIELMNSQKTANDDLHVFSQETVKLIIPPGLKNRFEKRILRDNNEYNGNCSQDTDKTADLYMNINKAGLDSDRNETGDGKKRKYNEEEKENEAEFSANNSKSQKKKLKTVCERTKKLIEKQNRALQKSKMHLKHLRNKMLCTTVDTNSLIQKKSINKSDRDREDIANTDINTKDHSDKENSLKLVKTKSNVSALQTCETPENSGINTINGNEVNNSEASSNLDLYIADNASDEFKEKLLDVKHRRLRHYKKLRKLSSSESSEYTDNQLSAEPLTTAEDNEQEIVQEHENDISIPDIIENHSNKDELLKRLENTILDEYEKLLPTKNLQTENMQMAKPNNCLQPKEVANVKRKYPQESFEKYVQEQNESFVNKKLKDKKVEQNINTLDTNQNLANNFEGEQFKLTETNQNIQTNWFSRSHNQTTLSTPKKRKLYNPEDMSYLERGLIEPVTNIQLSAAPKYFKQQKSIPNRLATFPQFVSARIHRRGNIHVNKSLKREISPIFKVYSKCHRKFPHKLFSNFEKVVEAFSHYVLNFDAVEYLENWNKDRIKHLQKKTAAKKDKAKRKPNKMYEKVVKVSSIYVTQEDEHTHPERSEDPQSSNEETITTKSKWTAFNLERKRKFPKIKVISNVVIHRGKGNTPNV